MFDSARRSKDDAFVSEPLVVTAAVAIPGRELTWQAVRSSGPGGQNVNKVASKVVLRFDLAGSRALDAETKTRLATAARNRIDAEGGLVITSSLTRDRERNLDDARAKLASLIRTALERPRVRRPTRPTAGSRRRRLDEKRRHAGVKRERRSSEGE